MSARLTFNELARAGTDAGKLWDAHYWEVERAVPANEAAAKAQAAELKRLDRLHADYFGEVAA